MEEKLRKSFGRYVTGVAIVSTNYLNDQAIGLTINSFSSLSLNPAMVIWNLSIKSSAKNIFTNCNNYVIQILSNKQANLAKIFSKKNIFERFDEVKKTMSPSGTFMINDNFTAWFDCYNYKQYVEGDHIIMIGKVEHLFYSEINPLIFYNGKLNENFNS
ncbi:flavin reductase family protein [Candidatus Kinetoplastidibacterium crithidiae]|uniref:Putative monooxygenase component n=1 Tax=Candidatus Kinetoplastidibacterium crithidiae TCC036E TaxID=1208918 RepID=M1LXA4_9PROT|nr:flavin reductase family protein [Candidatus Kinetoplastibacterium crithidii]AFZ82505.1 monooxygenase component [Candidatus Kinetoplastibacterium crithidii (ex Angomonas deanei ATCC 30255)]AGF47834.1 putative monooxygenase component [Candidatus Kinetoplastibacterium crithidii TCC036E]